MNFLKVMDTGESTTIQFNYHHSAKAPHRVSLIVCPTLRHRLQAMSLALHNHLTQIWPAWKVPNTLPLVFELALPLMDPWPPWQRRNVEKTVCSSVRQAESEVEWPGMRIKACGYQILKAYTRIKSKNTIEGLDQGNRKN